MAKPHHIRRLREHGCGLAVGEEAQIFYGGETSALHPLFALFAEKAEHFGDFLRVGHSELRQSLAVAHFDAHIGAGQAGESFFVCGVVAQKQHGFGCQTVTEPV